jgi:hypothetical protein
LCSYILDMLGWKVQSSWWIPTHCWTLFTLSVQECGLSKPSPNTNITGSEFQGWKCSVNINCHTTKFSAWQCFHYHYHCT